MESYQKYALCPINRRRFGCFVTEKENETLGSEAVGQWGQVEAAIYKVGQGAKKVWTRFYTFDLCSNRGAIGDSCKENAKQ